MPETWMVRRGESCRDLGKRVPVRGKSQSKAPEIELSLPGSRDQRRPAWLEQPLGGRERPER